VLADRSGRLEELVGGLELALRSLLRGRRRAQTIPAAHGPRRYRHQREARGAQARKSGTLTITMDNASVIQHAVAIKGNGLNVKGKTVGKGRRLDRVREPEARDLRVLLSGRWARAGRHEGNTDSQVDLHCSVQTCERWPQRRLTFRLGRARTESASARLSTRRSCFDGLRQATSARRFWRVERMKRRSTRHTPCSEICTPSHLARASSAEIRRGPSPSEAGAGKRVVGPELA
jgi:hypothetical protein